MNGNCKFCQIINSDTAYKLYENDTLVAILNNEPASLGHILIFPKKHYTILEQIPDFEIESLFQVANKLSIAVFETLNIGGTNMIVNNGVAAGQLIPHVCINLIPRAEGDKLNFEWIPQQISEEEMSTAELKLTEACKAIGEFEQKKKDPLNLDKKEDTEKLSDEENYLIKQLERIP